MTNETSKKLVAKIREILTPKLSEFIADSTIRVNCKRIGTTPDKLNLSQLPELAEKMKVSILLFLKDKEAIEIVQKIKNIRM